MDEPLEDFAYCHDCGLEVDAVGDFCAECQEKNDRAAHEEAIADLGRQHQEEMAELERHGP